MLLLTTYLVKHPKGKINLFCRKIGTQAAYRQVTTPDHNHSDIWVWNARGNGFLRDNARVEARINRRSLSLKTDDYEVLGEWNDYRMKSMKLKNFKDKINSNLHCFAIENHQGVRGPESIDPIPVIVSDIEEAFNIIRDLNFDSHEETSALAKISALASEVVLQAWLNRGHHAEIPNEWVDSACADSVDFPV